MKTIYLLLSLALYNLCCDTFDMDYDVPILFGEERGVTTPATDSTESSDSIAARLLGRNCLYKDLVVMTRNVYVGANVDEVLAAETPDQVPMLAAVAYQTMQSTNFTERAAAFAREVRQINPHLIGLQEISLIRLQTPGDAVVGGTTPATQVAYDFLDILLKAFERKGLHYYVAGKIENIDVEVPMLAGQDPPAFSDIRLTDYDVLLARSDVPVSRVVTHAYTARLSFPSIGLELPRGYVAADAVVKGVKYRVVTTHPEPAPVSELEPLQTAQVTELLESLASENLPVVLMGDLNTIAPTGATYPLYGAAGFVDLWDHNINVLRGPGKTCCYADDLRSGNLDRRMDLVFFRDSRRRAVPPNVVFGTVVGDASRDRTSSGLWPSDHAGVAYHLYFVPSLSYL